MALETGFFFVRQRLCVCAHRTWDHDSCLRDKNPVSDRPAEQLRLEFYQELGGGYHAVLLAQAAQHVLVQGLFF